MRVVLLFLLICHLSISPLWVSAQTSNPSNVESDVLGPLYPIVEPNLLTMLEKHAQESTTDTQSRFHEVRRKLENWSNHPIGQALPVATQYVRKQYPTYESVKHYLPEDYRRDWLFIDTQDQMQLKLAKHFLQNCSRTDRCRIPTYESVKHYLPEDYRRDWLFIDTQDQMQLKLAKHFLQNCSRTDRCRIIVVHGELKAMRERLKTPLWFDQGAKLTKQLHITHVPTLVTLTREAIVTHAAHVKNFPLEKALAS